MQRPVQITLRDIEASPALEARIRELALRLERFEGQILSCHVTLERPHRHHQHGQRYYARIRVCVAGAEVVVTRQSGHDPARAGAYAAVSDAFEVTARKLEELGRRRERMRVVRELAVH